MDEIKENNKSYKEIQIYGRTINYIRLWCKYNFANDFAGNRGELSPCARHGIHTKYYEAIAGNHYFALTLMSYRWNSFSKYEFHDKASPEKLMFGKSVNKFKSNHYGKCECGNNGQEFSNCPYAQAAGPEYDKQCNCCNSCRNNCYQDS